MHELREMEPTVLRHTWTPLEKQTNDNGRHRNTENHLDETDRRYYIRMLPTKLVPTRIYRPPKTRHTLVGLSERKMQRTRTDENEKRIEPRCSNNHDTEITKMPLSPSRMSLWNDGKTPDAPTTTTNDRKQRTTPRRQTRNPRQIDKTNDD